MTDYRLILRPEPSNVPEAIRLRRLLKLAGRYLGLKCIDVREIASTAPENAPLEDPKCGFSGHSAKGAGRMGAKQP